VVWVQGDTSNGTFRGELCHCQTTSMIWRNRGDHASDQFDGIHVKPYQDPKEQNIKVDEGKQAVHSNSIAILDGTQSPMDRLLEDSHRI